MYEILQTEMFTQWFSGLRDTRAKARIRARIERAHIGNFGDWAPEGGELRSLRIDYGPGYRLYYTIRDGIIIILLCGGDKRTQKADIKRAHALLEEV
jgi:putative addiction module killer protein